MLRLVKINSSVPEITKETEQGLKNWPAVITKYTTDSKRALRNVSFLSTQGLHSCKNHSRTKAEPASQQRT